MCLRIVFFLIAFSTCFSLLLALFVYFLPNIGLLNFFSQYEQREVRFHAEKQEQLKKFDNELDRLRNELEYLKSEDKRGMVFLYGYSLFAFDFFTKMNLLYFNFACWFLVKEKIEEEKVERLTKHLEELKKKEDSEKKVSVVGKD